MKKIVLIIVAIMVSGNSALGAMTMCISLSDCMTNATASFPYCCKQYSTGTAYSCPDGWSRIGTKCTRSDSSTGSDGTGTYTITYWDCDAQQTSFDCYAGSDSGTDSQGAACFKSASL